MRSILLGVLALVACALPVVAAARIVKWGRGTAVTCGTTATALDDTSVSDSLPRYVTVQNPSDSAGTVYIGDASVTVANGFPLAPGRTFGSGERTDPELKLYCIVASGTIPVRVQEAF